VSEETDTSGGDDFDPSELTSEVAEEAQREEQEERGEEEVEDDVPEPKRAMKPAAKAPEKPASKPPPPKTYRVKSLGQEREIAAEKVEALAAELGVDPEVLLRGAGMFRAGQERARQAAEAEKKARALEERLKKDPRAALREALGGDEELLKLAVGVVEAQMEAEKLTPEQRRIKELEAEQAKTKAEREEGEQKRQSEESQAYQAKTATRLADEIRGALEAGKIPPDPYAVKRLASLMQDHLDEGGDADDLEVADFLPLLNEGLGKEHAAYLDKLDGESIRRLFPALYDKIRKHAAGSVRRQEPPKRQPEVLDREEKGKPRQRLTTADVLRRFQNGGR